MQQQVERLLTVLMHKVIEGIPNGKGGYFEQPVESEARLFLHQANDIADAAVAAAARTLLVTEASWSEAAWKNTLVVCVGALPLVGGATASFYPQFEHLWKQLRFITVSACIYGHDVRSEGTQCQIMLCLVDEMVRNTKMPTAADGLQHGVRIASISIVKKLALKGGSRLAIGTALGSALGGMLVGVVPGVIGLVHNAFFGGRGDEEARAKVAQELVTRVQMHFKRDDHHTTISVVVLFLLWLLPIVVKQLVTLDRMMLRSLSDTLATHTMSSNTNLVSPLSPSASMAVVEASASSAGGGTSAVVTEVASIVTSPLWMRSGVHVTALLIIGLLAWLAVSLGTRLARIQPWLVSTTVLFIRAFLHFASANSVATAGMVMLHTRDLYMGHKMVVGGASILSRQLHDLKRWVPYVHATLLLWIFVSFGAFVASYFEWELRDNVFGSFGREYNQNQHPDQINTVGGNNNSTNSVDGLFGGYKHIADALDVISTLAMHSLVDEIQRPEIMVKLLGPRKVVDGLVFAARRLGALVAHPKLIIDWFDTTTPSPTVCCFLVAARMVALPLGFTWGVITYWEITRFSERLLTCYAVLVSVTAVLWQLSLPAPMEHKTWSQALTTRHRVLYLIPDLQPEVMQKLSAAVEFFEAYERTVYHTSVSILSSHEWVTNWVKLTFNRALGRATADDYVVASEGTNYEVVMRDDLVNSGDEILGEDADAVWKNHNRTESGGLAAWVSPSAWVDWVRGAPGIVATDDPTLSDILSGEEDEELSIGKTEEALDIDVDGDGNITLVAGLADCSSASAAAAAGQAGQQQQEQPQQQSRLAWVPLIGRWFSNEDDVVVADDAVVDAEQIDNIDGTVTTAMTAITTTYQQEELLGSRSEQHRDINSETSNSDVARQEAPIDTPEEEVIDDLEQVSLRQRAVGRVFGWAHRAVNVVRRSNVEQEEDVVSQGLQDMSENVPIIETDTATSSTDATSESVAFDEHEQTCNETKEKEVCENGGSSVSLVQGMLESAIKEGKKANGGAMRFPHSTSLPNSSNSIASFSSSSSPFSSSASLSALAASSSSYAASSSSHSISSTSDALASAVIHTVMYTSSRSFRVNADGTVVNVASGKGEQVGVSMPEEIVADLHWFRWCGGLVLGGGGNDGKDIPEMSRSGGGGNGSIDDVSGEDQDQGNLRLVFLNFGKPVCLSQDDEVGSAAIKNDISDSTLEDEVVDKVVAKAVDEMVNAVATCDTLAGQVGDANESTSSSVTDAVADVVDSVTITPAYSKVSSEYDDAPSCVVSFDQDVMQQQHHNHASESKLGSDKRKQVLQPKSQPQQLPQDEGKTARLLNLLKFRRGFRSAMPTAKGNLSEVDNARTADLTWFKWGGGELDPSGRVRPLFVTSTSVAVCIPSPPLEIVESNGSAVGVGGDVSVEGRSNDENGSSKNARLLNLLNFRRGTRSTHTASENSTIPAVKYNAVDLRTADLTWFVWGGGELEMSGNVRPLFLASSNTTALPPPPMQTIESKAKGGEGGGGGVSGAVVSRVQGWFYSPSAEQNRKVTNATESAPVMDNKNNEDGGKKGVVDSQPSIKAVEQNVADLHWFRFLGGSHPDIHADIHADVDAHTPMLVPIVHHGDGDDMAKESKPASTTTTTTTPDTSSWFASVPLFGRLTRAPVNSVASVPPLCAVAACAAPVDVSVKVASTVEQQQHSPPLVGSQLGLTHSTESVPLSISNRDCCNSDRVNDVSLPMIADLNHFKDCGGLVNADTELIQLC